MPDRVLQLSACTVDLERGEVHSAGARLSLTELERALLRHLAEHADQTVSREDLLQHVWGYQPNTETRAVDIAIRRLREKLGEPGRGGHLRTVHGVGYRFSLPPRLRLTHLPGLPNPEGRLIGRQAELERVDAALRADRALAIQGPPGVGKTRLAVSYGASRFDEYRAAGGVWWTPLASAADAEAMVAMVAGTLEIPLGAGAGAARVGDALAARGPLLLVLDNLDVVAAEVAPILVSWLARAPALRLLCTSQRPLPGLPTLALSPLLPEDAAELFLARARLVRPDFPAEGVPALVAALDHHPLSLELAAGWARLLDADALRIRVETGARGGGVETALARSWALLSPEEAAAMEALSVFRGGFSAEAAEAVIGPDGLGLLESLIRSSLVTSAGTRARLLEVVRQRAAVALTASGREAEVRARHAAWLVRRVAPIAERQGWSPDPSVRASLRAEQANLAAALEGGVSLTLRAPIACALADLQVSLGQEPRALAALRGLGDCAALSVAAQREVLRRSAVLTARIGEVEAGERACVALDALQDPIAAAWARYASTLILGKRGRLEAAAQQAEAAAAQAEREGEARLMGLALLERAVMATTLGDIEGGISWYQRALEALRAAGDLPAQGRALCNLGLVHGLLGRQEVETALLTQAHALLVDCGLPRDLANCELILAASLLEQGSNTRAVEIVESAGRRVAAMGDPFSHLRYRLVAGEIARDAGRFGDAETQLLAGLVEAERMDHHHYRAALLRALGELYDVAGQTERALGVYLRALQAAAEGRNPNAHAQVLGLLGCLAADGDQLDVAEPVLGALPPDLDEREIRLAHLDLARARAHPEAAAHHRAAAAERLRRARRGGPGLRFSVANSERQRSAVRLLESRLRTDGGLLRPLEPWVVARVVAVLLGGAGGAQGRGAGPP